MIIIIEGISFISADDFRIESVNCHVHFTKLSIELNFFLTKEGKFVTGIDSVRGCAAGVYKIAGTYKHTTRTTGRIKNLSVCWLNDVYNHSYKRFWSKEYSVITGNVFCKLIQEIFVDSADYIIFNFVESIVVKKAEKVFK